MNVLSGAAPALTCFPSGGGFRGPLQAGRGDWGPQMMRVSFNTIAHWDAESRGSKKHAGVGAGLRAGRDQMVTPSHFARPSGARPHVFFTGFPRIAGRGNRGWAGLSDRPWIPVPPCADPTPPPLSADGNEKNVEFAGVMRSHLRTGGGGILQLLTLQGSIPREPVPGRGMGGGGGLEMRILRETLLLAWRKHKNYATGAGTRTRASDETPGPADISTAASWDPPHPQKPAEGQWVLVSLF